MRQEHTKFWMVGSLMCPPTQLHGKYEFFEIYIFVNKYANSFWVQRYLNEHGAINEQVGRKSKCTKQTGCKKCEQVAMKVWSC